MLLVDATNGANQNGNDNVPAGPGIYLAVQEWTALFVHALKEADWKGDWGLEVTLNITSGWNLGGPWVQPEQASKLLTWVSDCAEDRRDRCLTRSCPRLRTGSIGRLLCWLILCIGGSSIAGKSGDALHGTLVL